MMRGIVAYKAAKMLMDEFEIRDGVHITLDKHIPVAAGLAGGARTRRRFLSE